MKYLIHTCTNRRWYVDKYIIPSMLQQNINREDISVYCDDKQEGILVSTMNTFRRLSDENDGGLTWHLQDDVLLSSTFAQRTKEYEHTNAIICGFCSKYDATPLNVGRVGIDKMWYSFPCIMIPNKIAGECANWFFKDVINNPEYRMWVRKKKYVDSIFRIFMEDYYPDNVAINVSPNLVDHVDYLIGGSLVNACRDQNELVKSLCWEEPELLDELKERLRDE